MTWEPRWDPSISLQRICKNSWRQSDHSPLPLVCSPHHKVVSCELCSALLPSPSMKMALEALVRCRFISCVDTIVSCPYTRRAQTQDFICQCKTRFCCKLPFQKVIYSECGQSSWNTLSTEQRGCSIPASVQDQLGWGFWSAWSSGHPCPWLGNWN